MPLPSSQLYSNSNQLGFAHLSSLSPEPQRTTWPSPFSGMNESSSSIVHHMSVPHPRWPDRDKSPAPSSSAVRLWIFPLCLQTLYDESKPIFASPSSCTVPHFPAVTTLSALWFLYISSLENVGTKKLSIASRPTPGS